MSGSNIRNYQVNYAINAEGNAAEFFIQMAENATKMQEPLSALSAQIRGISRSLQLLGRNENLKNLFALQPTLDLTKLKTGLAKAEKLVSQSAERMAGQLNTALANAATLKKTKAQSAVKRTKDEIQALMRDMENQFFKVSGGKKINDKSIKGKDDTTAEAWKVRQQYNKLKKELKAPTKIPKTAATILDYTKRAKDITGTAEAITKLNESLSAFKTRKRSVTIDADIAPAITKLNTLLETIRGSVAAVPVTLGESGKGKKGSGKKTSGTNVSTAKSSTVTKLLNGKEKTLAIQANFNGGETASQINQAIAKLQELAQAKPIVLRGIFSLDKAGFQLNQAIANLQKLADGKPIVLKATSSTPIVAGASENKAETLQTATVKDGKGSTQVNVSKGAGSTQSQINAWEQHQQPTADLSHIIANAQMQAKKDAKRQAISDRNAIRASQHNAWELAKLHNITAQQAFLTPNETASRRTSAQLSRSGSSGRFTTPQDNLYTRSRAFWYPLTGNTSFGARTPMAVDMAKGMGTMFAIGGAMSAVGSSLNQAVEYQNIMKTTNAILKNGTDNYSSSGFKGMEQIVRQVGKDTKFTAPQVASAAKFLAMAGYDIPSINSAIKPVSNIALIGDTDLGETADKLTNVMTTFGIMPEKMNDIADIMTTTFTRSNTTMMMLAESAKYAGGIANLYGGNFQNNFADVMAMFGVLGNSGIQASSAGTTLRMMYQNLMQPNKSQRATLKQYGINTRDTIGHPLEMVEILKQIAAKVPQDKLADAVGNMFRITAQPGAAALANSLKNGNKSSLLRLMEANRTAAGSGISESIANEKKNTIAGLWAQVTSTFTEGVLQAFEGKEGGWAGMLAQLRDYLAQPETVETLRSIIDLVENLAKVMGDFAKVYAKVYSMFPGIINSWIKFQLVATQFGYLVTPIIQLIGILSMLKTAILGTATAATTATVAENTAKRARVASSVMSGLAPRYANYIQSGRAAANYNAYQFGMAYWMRKRASRSSIANRYGANAISMLKNMRQADFWAIAATNPELAATIGHTPTLGVVEYSKRYPKSQIAQEYAKAQFAAKHTSAASSKVQAVKTQYFDALRAERRSSQIANGALVNRYMNRYSTLGGDAVLATSIMAQRAAYEKRIGAIASARHATRGIIDSNVVNRYARTASWGKGMGLAWKNSFSAGQAMGMLNLSGMIYSIKGAFASLISGLAKAIGLLVSPIGLVTVAIGTAVAATIVQINRIKKAQAESVKQAKSDAQKMTENQKTAYKPIEDMDKKYRTIGNTLTPAEDSGSAKAVKQSKQWYDTYIGAFNINSDAKEANKAWYTSILGNKNTRLAFGNRQLSYANSWKASNENAFKQSINYGGDKINAEQLTAQQRNARNYNAADSRAREALFLAGASSNSTVQAQNKIIELKQQLLTGKITNYVYTKQANEIRAAVANPKMPGLLNAMNYSATELQKASDITRFTQYQQGAWNLLTAELNADIGTLSGYLEGVEQLKKGVKAYSDQWWYAVARVYDGLKYPLEIAGKTTDIVLNALPDGRIDTSRIIAQIQSIADNLQLNITDFAKMASSVYEAMAKIGAVPGKYYSDFMRFTWSQVAHSDVTATDAGLYFDQYIAKGNKDATWGGLNRQQYIDYIQSSSGNKGRAAKERNLIRKTMANRAAINAKNQYDKAMQDINNSTSKDNDLNTSGTNGTNTGADSTKNQKDYKNTYDRSIARPTQVVINIDKLANFDRTAIAKNTDDRAIIEMMENKIAEAVAMLSTQALNSASSLIAQNV